MMCERVLSRTTKGGLLAEVASATRGGGASVVELLSRAEEA